MDEKKSAPLLSCRIFYIFLLYTIFIWSCELLDLACFLMKLPQITWASRLAAAGATALAARFLIGRVRFYKAALDPVFWLGALAFAAFFALKSIRPDMSYDTMNYHLLCQIPGFTDNLNYHVLPGRFQMYGFRLGDRMFYPFRLLLGLRMGTMLNALAMILIFRQITVIFTWLRDRFDEEKRVGACWISLLAFLTAGRFELLMQSGSYMVELLALPFFLEMVFFLIQETASEEAAVRREAFLYCLCGGVLFCLKMTNIVFIAPLVLLYIWKIRRHIVPSVFASCLLAGAVPVLLYLVYNCVCTGNPVYPYYNTIFHSPYFGDYNFKDMRWGPLNLKELLLWPYYMIRYPEYRLSEIYATYNWDLISCYMAMAVLLFLSIRGALKEKKLCRVTWTLFLLYALSFAGWAATTGHIRYFCGGLLLGGIFPVILHLWAVGSKRRKWAVLSLLLLIPFAGRAFYGFQSVYRGNEWALRGNSRMDYAVNRNGVFRDREIFPSELRENTDMVLLTWGDYGSFARLMGEDVPVWNRRVFDTELLADRDQYLDRIQAMMREGKNILDMFPQGEETLTAYLELQNENNYYVEDMFYLKNALWGRQAFTMARLGAADERKNDWYFCGERAFTFDKDSDRPVLRAIAGNTAWWLLSDTVPIQIIASDGKTAKQAAAFELEEEYERIELPLDLSGLEGEISLEFSAPKEQTFSRKIIINPVIMPEVQ